MCPGVVPLLLQRLIGGGSAQGRWVRSCWQPPALCSSGRENRAAAHLQLLLPLRLPAKSSLSAVPAGPSAGCTGACPQRPHGVDTACQRHRAGDPVGRGVGGGALLPAEPKIHMPPPGWGWRFWQDVGKTHASPSPQPPAERAGLPPPGLQQPQLNSVLWNASEEGGPSPPAL